MTTEGATPEEPAPPAQVPAPQPGQPLTPPNLGGQAPTGGMSGCAKAALIGGAVILVVGVILVGLAIVGVMRFADDVEGSFSEEPCPFISSEDASEVIGASVEATSGESAIGAILGLVRDDRLLDGAPSCFISSEDSSIQVWISVYDGDDAATVFAGQADIADGQVVTQETTDSGSITVETEDFRGDDVPGLGEEAFCTDVGIVASGGVLARSEDRVVYVTTLAMEENQGAEVFTGELCDRAIPIAEALLG